MIPVDSLLQLRHRLDRLPPKSPERAAQVASVAQLYGVSSTTVYRALHTFQKPHAAQRADRVFQTKVDINSTANWTLIP